MNSFSSELDELIVKWLERPGTTEKEIIEDLRLAADFLEDAE